MLISLYLKRLGKGNDTLCEFPYALIIILKIFSLILADGRQHNVVNQTQSADH